MARAAKVIEAAPEQVWAVLADGWSYAGWVVGTVKIRSIDGTWPELGSRLHHGVGAWPLTIEDQTKVLASEPSKLLRMRARGWPFGEAEVEVRLEEVSGGGTRLSFWEEPVRGPGAWVNNRLVDVVGRWRLAEMLDRFARIVEGRCGKDVQA